MTGQLVGSRRLCPAGFHHPRDEYPVPQSDGGTGDLGMLDEGMLDLGRLQPDATDLDLLVGASHVHESGIVDEANEVP